MTPSPFISASSLRRPVIPRRNRKVRPLPQLSWRTFAAMAIILPPLVAGVAVIVRHLGN